MIAKLHKPFSILLAFLLALTCLSTSGVSFASAAQRRALASPGLGAAQAAMPDGLLSAFLEASSQPFEDTGEGYRARAGGLEFTLLPGGLQAKGEGISWSLALSGIGRGEQAAPAAQAVIAQAGGRLEYRRGDLIEWYRQTALGLEQGFTIRQAEGGVGPLILQLDLSTGLEGALDSDGGGLSFTNLDGQSLRYDHLRVWDAMGVALGAALRYAPGQVTIQVSDQGAVYPITIDPLIYVEQKVIASDGEEYDYFGYSVALLGDTALVGTSGEDIGANHDQGSAYLFTRSGSAWTLQQKLIASDGAAYDNFGTSVALSGDTALVGTPYDDIGANSNQGSAYVFIRSGTIWSEQAHLTASNGAAGDWFGWSVALSVTVAGVGTALVGAQLDDIGTHSDQGSVYVFTRSGTTWSGQARLTASDGAAYDRFGCSVAFSGSSSGVDTALVGACLDDAGASGDQGSAYVFTRSGITWNQQAKLTASDGAAGDAFGYAVALAGETALVGAPFADVGANTNQGSVYAFVRSGTTWSQQAKMTASDGAAGDSLGYAVSLYGDKALLGAPYDDIGANNNQGSAYVFTRSGTTWSQSQKSTASDGVVSDLFGYAVAFEGSLSGVNTALVGAWGDDFSVNQDQGSAYVFAGTYLSFQQKLTVSDGAFDDEFGCAVALSGDTAMIGVWKDNIGANADQGSVYVFARNGTTWSLQQKLFLPDGEADDRFGTAVALSGETALVGAYKDDVGANDDQGSVFVFTRSGTAWSMQQQLTASDGEKWEWFGTSVALSGDTALVGLHLDKIDGKSSQGSAYIFTRSGTTWSEQAHLIASDGAMGDRFGYSVALEQLPSGDAMALVGAYTDDYPGGKQDQGSAYIFGRSGTDWTEQARLAPSDGAANDNFGSAVALSIDVASGDVTALVGAYKDDVGANSDQGSAYIFTRSGTTWSEQAHLIASDGAAADYFGVSVAVEGIPSGYGMALVGAYADNVGANSDQGSAYVFTHSGTAWSELGRLTASDGAQSDDYGMALALSESSPGEYAAVVGAYMDNILANQDQGSAYFYQFDPYPGVVSITRLGPNPTSASSMDFTVSFSEAVTDVDITDFVLTKTGTLTGETVTNVSGSGAAYIVTVSISGGSGTLRLDIPGTATIDDLIGNPLYGLPYESGEAYTILSVGIYLPLVLRDYDPNRSMLDDPAGDWLPGAVQLNSTDILAASAERRLDEGVIILTMDLAGDLPQTLPAEERNRWTWLLDTDLNASTGDPWYDIGVEYQVNLHIQWDGFYVDVRDWNNNWTPVPGAATINGSTVTLHIPVSFLGGAIHFKWMVVVEPFDRLGDRFDIAPNLGYAQLP